VVLYKLVVSQTFLLCHVSAPVSANIGAGIGGASARPTKLLGEQVIHPASPIFFCTFQIFWATSHVGNRGDRGEHGHSLAMPAPPLLTGFLFF